MGGNWERGGHVEDTVFRFQPWGQGCFVGGEYC